MTQDTTRSPGWLVGHAAVTGAVQHREPACSRLGPAPATPRKRVLPRPGAPIVKVMPRTRHGLVLAASALLALTSCNGGPDSPISPSDLSSLELTSLVSSVEISTTRAASRPGAAPTPAGGPQITVSGNPTVVNGGTLSAVVAASSPFQAVYVYVESNSVSLATEAAGGIDGYFELRLPAPQTTATILLTFPQTIPLSELDFRFAVANPSGAIGPYASLSTSVASVGTGDVQVTLSWDADSDVDLHVVDPSGEEVYYANRTAASGGALDLDSNAGCSIDGVRNENITWPVGRAPRGQYTVRVDYWSSCGVERTNYTVRVNSGGNVQIFTGTFTGSGDQGGRGSGTLITAFERTTGPAAAAFDATAAAGSAAAGATSTKTLTSPHK